MITQNQDKKNIIINIALQLFNKYGYEKTSLSDIANSLGKGRTTIYKYFNNKEEIFQSIAKADTDSYIAKLENRLGKVDSAIKKISTYCRLKFDFTQCNNKEQLIINKHYPRNKELLLDVKHDAEKRETEILESIIRFGIDTGEFEQFSGKQIRVIPKMLHHALCGIINDVRFENENTGTTKALAQALLIKSLKK